MASVPVNPAFYADPQGLAALRGEAKTQSPEALREAARQFEGIFTQMMLKSMRDATPKDSLFGSDQQDFYQDMFDQQMAQQMSRGRGLGLADMLVRQLQAAAGVQAQPAAEAGAGAAPAAVVGAPPAALAWPPANREAFVERLWPAAQDAGRQLGVDPRTLIAHAALETAWGRSLPADGEQGCSFNLFGIKTGSSWSGESVGADTLEFETGNAVMRRERFRAYDSPEACMRDYAALLGKPRYAEALGTGEDAAAFASALQRAGYATDPQYATKLTAIARELKSAGPGPINGRGSSQE